MNALQGERRAPPRPGDRLEPPAIEADGGRRDIDIGTLIGSVWRGKLIVAACGFGLALLAMAAVYSVTPRFRADAVVMLDRTEEQVIDVQSVVSGMTPDFFSILAEAEVLRSRKLAARVVEAMNLTEHPLFNPQLLPPSEPPLPLRLIGDGIELLQATVRGAVTDREAPGRELLDPDYVVRQVAIDRLLQMQSVSAVDNTYVYQIEVETVDPLLSAEIANTFAELYITDQLETKFEATQAATEWLTERVAQLRVELEAAESAVEAYNTSTTLISEEALAGGSRQLKELRERRGELAQSIGALDTRAAELETALALGDADRAGAAAGDPRIALLAAELAALPADAPESRREMLEGRVAFAKDRALASLAAERDRALRQIEQLDVSILGLEAQLADQSEDLVELRQLQREAEANRRIYEQFLRRLNETSVQQGVQQADARLLSPAVVDFKPSYPNKVLAVLAAGFVGGLIGIGLVILREHLNVAFVSSEELEQTTGIPVLGAIPAAPVRKRRSLLTYAAERPSSQLVEAVRNLRTGVLLANVDNPPKVVMLTSSLPKEGKTTCSLLLAQNAAAMGRRTLLLECDLRRRTFRSYFDLPGKDGLMSVLTGAKTLEEVVHRDEALGFDVLPGEEVKANAADVFASRRFGDFVESLRDRYDFIVIDTPPVLAVPDARVIATLVDAVIYCVRWNTTHRDLVKSGLAALTQINVRVAGLALTQINLRKLARYGYGGYNYYYYKSSSQYYLN